MNNFFSSWHCNYNDEFDEIDSFRWFRKNKKKQNHNWIYNSKKICYKTNELGFRTFPMSHIDWQKSIVVFGCSNVYGTGLAEEDTLCSVMSKITGMPVINLGIVGSAVDMAVFNSFYLYKNLPHPRAIIQIWTSLHRYTFFNFNGDVNKHNINQKNYIHKMNWTARNKIHIEQDRELWKNSDTIYHEASFFENTAKNKIQFLNSYDTARDLSHPGIESNKQAARQIVKELRKNLFFLT